jgi:hypothetical protein
MKSRVLVFAPNYLPSTIAGGPVRSISNLVNRYQDRVDFKIITPNKDLDGTIFSNVKSEEWTSIFKHKVYYVKNYLKSLYMIINSKSEFDVIYLNSLFSLKYSIIPILLCWLNLIKVHKVVLAPRGEFASSALSIKSSKKRLFMFFSLRINLYKNVFFHATSTSEYDDIRLVFDNNITLVSNISAQDVVADCIHKLRKTKGVLHIVSLARISSIKNLLFSLEILQSVSSSSKIYFDIYGPIEDKKYWMECVSLIEQMPPHITVSYKGIVDSSDVLNVLNKYQLYLLPTKGENFGHSIIESLKSICPVLISDQTPWRDLENKNIGWDVCLSDMQGFKMVIEKMASLDESDMLDMYESIRFFTSNYLNDESVDAAYEGMFRC